VTLAGDGAAEPREASESEKQSLSPQPHHETAGDKPGTKGSALVFRGGDEEGASESASSTSSAQERREGEPNSMAVGVDAGTRVATGVGLGSGWWPAAAWLAASGGMLGCVWVGFALPLVCLP
jgi:hypothetical protein